MMTGLKGQWDSPKIPLTLAAFVGEGDPALAPGLPGGKGGTACLPRRVDPWLERQRKARFRTRKGFWPDTARQTADTLLQMFNACQDQPGGCEVALASSFQDVMIAQPQP